MKEKIEQIMKKLLKTGFFSIYCSSICSKVITLFGGILIVRLLSQEDYGVYTLVLNAISIMTIFGDFGISGAVLQYGIENENDLEKQKGIFYFGIKMAIISSLVSSGLILCSRFFYPYKNNEIMCLTTELLAIPILTALINYFSIILRAKRKNNKFSLYQILTTLIHYIVIILFTLIGGLKGCLLSQYIYNIIIIIIGVFLLKDVVKVKKAKLMEKKEKKEFMKLALGTQVNNTINSLLYSMDIFILGIVACTTDVSIYKVATVIPTALVFLPQCLNIYILPYFISHNKDYDWVNKKTKKLLKYTIPFYFIISAFLIILAKPMFYILYGADYISAVSSFIILIIGFFFTASIKSNLLNIIYSMRKIKFALKLGMTSFIMNLILDVIFVRYLGLIGIAISTMLVNVLSAVIAVIYFRSIMKRANK